MPAQADIPLTTIRMLVVSGIPAFAGMTGCGEMSKVKLRTDDLPLYFTSKLRHASAGWHPASYKLSFGSNPDPSLPGDDGDEGCTQTKRPEFPPAFAFYSIR